MSEWLRGVTIRITPEEDARLLRAWTQSGRYRTRSAFIKDAINRMDPDNPIFLSGDEPK